MRALVMSGQRLVGELAAEGFAVRAAPDGDGAVRLARTVRPDVVVLDASPPTVDAIEICRRVRAVSPAYLMLLGESDVPAALAAGADDCMAGPLSVRELVARVKAMLRRPRTTRPAHQAQLFGDLWLDPLGREVRVGGRAVDLTPREFDVLAALAARPRTAFSRRQLVASVWGHGADEHVVDIHVAHLRRKLGDDPANPRYVRTVRGVGYRMGSGHGPAPAGPGPVRVAPTGPGRPGAAGVSSSGGR